MVFFLLFSFTLKAGEFPIKINDVSGLNTSWPILTSISFPEGEIIDSSNIRIMSGEKEVPSQVDVTATWRDGSIRWALAGFTASPQGNYRVEFGEGIKRGRYPNPLKVTKLPNDGFEVNTGVAIYRFVKNKLLPDEGWIVSGKEKRQILENSGAGAYLIDNSNREARVSGETSEITNEVLKEGPNRLAIKRSGWYVTTSGEKLARADVWLYFTAGVPHIKITHSLIFTEDTNKVWFKDYGLEFKTPEQPKDIFFALGEPGEKETVGKIINNSDETYILQSDYPHFAERDYKAVLGKSANGKDSTIAELQIAGDWGYGDYGSYGITIVMPWLAERFPKEISFGQRGARAVLWSGRSGNELDFRAKTLVKDYYKNWVTKGLSLLKDTELDALKSNAQGTARTHDIWFLPLFGEYKEGIVRKTALAGARQILAFADHKWLCETEAMGYPMLHKDTEKFLEEETIISEHWDRFIMPLKAFPMMGYIAWGCYPDRSYGEAGGKPMSTFHALSNLREYGVRREPWRHLARSGERRYYDYGHRFSRFTGDWYLAHWDAPGSPVKIKGRFITTPGGSGRAGLIPLFWGDRTHPFSINAGDIGHWLLDYYLTGDEQSFELVKIIKDSFKKLGWRPKGVPGHFHALGIRTLLTLHIMDWDEDAGKALKELVDEMIDLESQNGFCLFKDHYGSMYKDHRTSHNIVEYYLETKDELAKEAFLKLLDQRYRFDRRGAFVSYKNYDGFTHSIAYWLTGDEKYRTIAEEVVRETRYYHHSSPLSEDLAQKPTNPLDWKNLYVPGRFPGPRTTFFMGHHEYHNPFIGLPTALKLLSEKGWSGKTTPLVVKPMKEPVSEVIFYHQKGKDTELNICVKISSNIELLLPQITSYKSKKHIKGVKTEIEKVMSLGPFFTTKPDIYPSTSKTFNLNVTVPSETLEGLYFLSFTQDVTFTVLDSTSDKVALYCPLGFWSISMGQHSGSGSYGRSGEGLPAFFKVPEKLKEVEIFLGRPAKILYPDGEIALDFSEENIGNVKIPVEGKGGIWSVEYDNTFRSTCPPVFIKLINVEPIVSFISPDLLPEKTVGQPVQTVRTSLPSPTEPFEFVEGISNKGMRLSDGQTIVFSRGKQLEAGGYTFFPENEGTVEFWFRSDRTSHETPMKMTQVISQTFLKSSSLHLRHHTETRAGQRSFDSNLRLELRPIKTTFPLPGFIGNCFFYKDEWNHLAFVWKVEEGKKMDGNLDIYLNGKRLLPTSGYTRVTNLKGSPQFKLSFEVENISIGPFDGTIDLLRISDIVRYTNDFEPSKKYGLDKNTRALFEFDNNLKGVSAFTKEPIVGKKAYGVSTHSGTTAHTPSTPQSGTLRTHPSAYKASPKGLTGLE